jgi:hypothetical protein
MAMGPDFTGGLGDGAIIRAPIFLSSLVMENL